MDKKEWQVAARRAVLGVDAPLLLGCTSFASLVPNPTHKMAFYGGAKFTWSLIEVLLNNEITDEAEANQVKIVLDRLDSEIRKFDVELTEHCRAQA